MECECFPPKVLPSIDEDFPIAIEMEPPPSVSLAYKC